VVLGGILKMKTGFFCLCLVAAFALSIESAKAQQQQQQQPGIQPSQPQQQPQQQQQQPPAQGQQQQPGPGQQQLQQGQYSQQQGPYQQGQFFDPTLLQGQWETACVPIINNVGILPSIYRENGSNGQRAIYTFVNDKIVYQVNEYTDPFCDPNDTPAPILTETGSWTFYRNIYQLAGAAQFDMYFRQCTGAGCALNSINHLYGESSLVFQFLRGPNQLFVGDVDLSGGIFMHYRRPLYRPGFAPEDPR
jgi:hypothetical protein